MCLIIDANKINDLVNYPDDPDHKTIYRWLDNQNGKIATGGLNLKELTKSDSGKRFISTLLQAGRALKYDDRDIRKEERKLVKSSLLNSNDEHVLALAVVSDARVLFSNDQALCDDFTNHNVLPKPRGKVYKNKSHWNLLLKSPPCRIPE